MKSKIILLSIILAISTTCAIASQYTKFSKSFIKNFKDCDEYEETVTSDFHGETFTTNRKILGWKNGFCKYQEIISTQKEKYKLNCSFSEIQLEELYLAMKDRSDKPEVYNLDVFSEKKDEKTGKVSFVKTGSTSIKGNKAYIIWAKYQNNPYFCTPTKL